MWAKNRKPCVDDRVVGLPATRSGETMQLDQSLAIAWGAASVLPEEQATLAMGILGAISDGRASIPTLSAAAAELMKLAQDPSTSIRTFGRTVREDPALSARVLQAANSPIYGVAAKNPSLQQAISVLGTERLRTIITQAVVEASVLGKGQRAELDAERKHATGVAHLCYWLAAKLDVPPATAFTAGLLHDIGRLVLPGAMAMLDRTVDMEAARPIVHLLHGPIGGYVARNWGLGQEVVDAAELHEDPDDADLLVKIVAFADQAVQTMHLHEPGCSREVEDLDVYLLNLDDEEMDDMWSFLVEVGNDTK